MQRVIILFGKPNAGKGTQLSAFLSTTDKKFKTVSVGNLLKQARKNETELGKKAAPFMDSGGLVPDDIINGIVIEDYKTSELPVIFDGFPRTVPQADALANALKKEGIIPLVINFHVEDETAIHRASVRIVCENCSESFTTSPAKPPLVKGICDKCGHNLVRRKDDEPEIFKNRLEVYKNETLPILEYFERNGIPIYTIDNTDPGAHQLFVDYMNHNT